jgi:hypothetical protein
VRDFRIYRSRIYSNGKGQPKSFVQVFWPPVVGVIVDCHKLDGQFRIAPCGELRLLQAVS